MLPLTLVLRKMKAGYKLKKNMTSVNHFLFMDDLNLIQDGFFRGCSRMGGGGKKIPPPPPPKTCHTYPTMIKLGTVIPYLKRTQKLYESRDTSLEFC